MIRPIVKILSLFQLCIILLGCSSSNSNDEFVERTYDDVRLDFSQLDFNTGTNDATLLNTANFLWSFRLYMPDINFTNNKRPLIIDLHGFSGNNLGAEKSTGCYIYEGFKSLDAIIISPNAGNFYWEDQWNQIQILSLVDLAVTYLPVDPTKIVVTGYSAGGNGSWYMGESQPNVFSAAIPIASSYNTSTNGTVRLIETPMYVIHGENDDYFPLEQTKTWVNNAIDAGADITFVVAPGLNHFQPCDYVEYVKDAADWLINDVW